MATSKLDEIFQMVDGLTEAILPTPQPDERFTDAEIREMLAPRPALTGKEIVEKHLKSGVIGSWADMGTEDSVEWLEQQRAIRRNI